MIGPGDARAPSPLQPNPDKHRVVVAVKLVEGDVLADLGVTPDLDPDFLDVGNVLVERGVGKAILRDSVAHHPTWFFLLLEYRHFISHQCQVVRGGQAGWAGADDRHFLVGRLDDRNPKDPLVVIERDLIHGVPL